MPLRILVIPSLLVTSILQGQRPFSENVWSSLILNYKKDKLGLVVDAGYRWCDHFVNSGRTGLFRMTLDRDFGGNNRLGVGYAYFEHYNSVNFYENRYFLQYGKAWEFLSSKWNLRFRNEIRTYNDRKTVNRSRLQGSWLKGLSEIFSTQLSAEIFYTPGKSDLLEQRYSGSLISNVTNYIKISTFYMIQLQSNVNYLQHIIGIQAQLAFEHQSANDFKTK